MLLCYDPGISIRVIWLVTNKYGQRRLDCIMDGPSPYESVVWHTELAGGIVGNSNLVHESEQAQLPCKRREDDIQF